MNTIYYLRIISTGKTKQYFGTKQHGVHHGTININVINYTNDSTRLKMYIITSCLLFYKFRCE